MHELSHQWFGDDVTIERWSDICLNECFASYGPWLWNAEVNGEDLDATWKQQMSELVNRRGVLAIAVGRHGSGPASSPGSTTGARWRCTPCGRRSATTRSSQILKEWPATYGGKNATFDDLETMVSNVAGRDLTPFMDAWFRGTTVPRRGVPLSRESGRLIPGRLLRTASRDPGCGRTLRGSTRRRQLPISRAARYACTWSSATRSCVIESRSRIVTDWSAAVSKSTVRQNGVPISSCRR